MIEEIRTKGTSIRDMPLESDSTAWVADEAREILAAGVDIQVTGAATNAVVAGIIRALLDHIDNLKADLDVAIAVGRYAAKATPPDMGRA